MIACDSCYESFHGKCKTVTEEEALARDLRLECGLSHLRTSMERWWLFPRVRGFGESIRQFIPASAFFFFFSGDQVAHTNSTLKARISPQWLSDGRREYFKWAIIVHFARGSSTGV